MKDQQPKARTDTLNPERVRFKDQLRPEYQTVVDEFRSMEHLPVIFKNRVEVAAQFMQSLEDGTETMTADGIDLSKERGRFASQMANSGFFNFVRLRVARGGATDDELPSWVKEADLILSGRSPRPLSAEERGEVINQYENYVKSQPDSEEFGEQYMAFFEGEGVSHKDENSIGYKLYLNNLELLKMDRVQELLRDLRMRKLHPFGMKLGSGDGYEAKEGVAGDDQLVMYFGHLNLEDRAVVLKTMEELGLESRGFAQDPKIISFENGEFRLVDSSMSNDSSLGDYRGGPKWGGLYDKEMYQPSEFLRRWIELAQSGYKDPAEPYQQIFVPALIPAEVDMASLKDYVESLELDDKAVLVYREGWSFAGILNEVSRVEPESQLTRDQEIARAFNVTSMSISLLACEFGYDLSLEELRNLWEQTNGLAEKEIVLSEEEMADSLTSLQKGVESFKLADTLFKVAGFEGIGKYITIIGPNSDTAELRKKVEDNRLKPKKWPWGFTQWDFKIDERSDD